MPTEATSFKPKDRFNVANDFNEGLDALDSEPVQKKKGKGKKGKVG